MRDPFRWSISLGRWGIPAVRLHFFFVVFAIATFYLSSGVTTARDGGSLFGVALAALALLFGSVLLHEWSHWWVARRYGMEPATLVLGPLGGLSEWGTAAKGEFACLIAGPLANLLVCLVCAFMLRVWFPQIELLQLLNPLVPGWSAQSSPLIEQGLKLCLWINWLLFLFNSLPAYPFDGGRALRSAISGVRPDWSRRRVAETVFWIAMALSTAIMTAALVLWKENTDPVYPIAFALLLLGVVLLVSARRDVEGVGEAESVEVDNTQLEDLWSATAAEDASSSAPCVSEQWLPSSAVREDPSHPEDREEEDERQVDEILTRLHAHGMGSLTSEERQLLERVSARYRSRLGRHT